MNIRTFIALILVVIALKLNNKPVDDSKPKPDPTPVVTIEIPKPAQEYIDKTADIAKEITDAEDRLKLAVFVHEFAIRVTNYEKVSNVNAIYSDVAKIVFPNKEISKKYKNFAGQAENLVRMVAGDKERELDLDELREISNNFEGLAWNLINQSG